MLENHFLIGAVLVACVGGISDLRSARIPNWLTYSGVVLALLLRTALHGWSGLVTGIGGLMAAGVPFFLLFVIGAMGGGDMKLTACVGAWAGSTHVLTVMLAALLAGGVLAVLYMLFGQGIRQTVNNTVELLRFHLISGLAPHPVLNIRDGRRVHVPFGVAVAMGTLFCAGNAIWWR